MKILITGGAGFVGSNLGIELMSKHRNYKIIAFDNLRRKGSEININRLREAGVEFVHGDVRNTEDLNVINEIDFIIDASADPSVLSGIITSVYPVLSNNLLGTINCLELASRCRAGFVFLSTSRVYPIKALENCNFEEISSRFQWTDDQNVPGVSSRGITEDFPLNGSRSFYGSSKFASEIIMQEYNELKGMKTVINRCGVISGPWQMGKVDQGVVVLWLARHMFKGKLKYLGYGGTGKQLRDVIHINDLVELVEWQIHNIEKVNGEIFNVGGGLDVSFSLLELTKLCQEITGNKIEITNEKQNRTADIRIYVTNNDKITFISGWKPKANLKSIVSDTFNWIKENENQLKRILE